MVLPSLKLPNFPAKFQPEHLLPAHRNHEIRSRKLTPEALFHAMIQLVGGANHEGYSHALMKAWEATGDGLRSMPQKSALCRTRQKVTFGFFKSQLDKLLKQVQPHRASLLGLHIYAIDGQMLTLPRSAEIVKAGFTGRPVAKYSESYYPKGFLTHAYDVLSGTTRDLRFTNRLHEQQDAEEMVSGLERESLTIYDRLYFGVRLVKAHYRRGNHFLFRCKRNACREVADFFADPSHPKTASFFLANRYQVHLIRIRNRKTHKDDVFSTSLDPSLLKDQFIRKLYRLRWEVETSFLELTGITQAEQWHCKSVNGIYQELYARMWLINYTKIQIHFLTEKPKNPLQDEYEKPNFKLLYNFILLSFPKILKRNPKVILEFEALKKISTERRIHGKRHYPREVKLPASPYPYRNTQWAI